MAASFGSSWPVALALVMGIFVVAHGKETIRLGILLPYGLPPHPNLAPGLAQTVNISINDVYDQRWLTRDYDLQYTIKSSGCNPLQAVGSVDDLHSVHAFIGPACSDACQAAALLAAHRNKTMISYSCSSTELTDRDLYPTFLRTQPYSRSFSGYTGTLLNSFISSYNWSRASIISPEDKIWSPIAISLRDELVQKNRTVPYFGLYANAIDEPFESYKTVMADAQKVSRVIFLLTHSEEVAQFLVAADELGMRNGEYAFITMDFKYDPSWAQGKEDWVKRVDKKRFAELFNGIINLSVKSAHGPRNEAFKQKITQELKSKNVSVDSMLLNFAGFLHDAIELYAVALNRTLSSGGNLTDGRAIVQNVTNQGPLFTGVTGDVALYDGSRIPVFIFSNRQNGTMVPLSEVDPSIDSTYRGHQITALWPGGTKVVPLDVPKCGFQGEKCVETPTEAAPQDYTVITVTSTLVPLVIIIILSVGLVYYRKQLYERDLMSTSWIISYADVVLVNQESGRFSTGRVKSQAHSLVSGIGDADVHSSDLGRYKGELVVIRRFGVDSINLTREIRAEVKKVRDLQHSNLNQFLGFCNEAPNVCMLSVYCQRGTLQDLLANDDIKIDWMFRMSFANDIASGMVALHNSPVECHGNLKSSNCFIDSRWVCKVADFGMDTLKSKLKHEEQEDYARFRDLFWTAPELLPESGSVRGKKKTQSGDVYSYAIILHEILTREEPYSTGLMMTTPKDIINKVHGKMIPPCRPDISLDGENDYDPRYLKLMIGCWDDQPNFRPPFKEIKSRLKELNKGRNMNIVDNMIQMMEKYTDQLEELVDERTKQLAEEKAKTDELLYKMLPRSIAEELKAGKAINAESFAGVTIFFSDIVGFTRLAAQSTPMQVVKFLNELYTCFDGVIDHHDVYKVETIGDAYMVVSGLPVRNGDKHAGEIATMALNLLSSVRDFTVSHLGTKVQMRIGIHSGSCVAGVVGLKMPRYCLFGDTVNYASRMESSGLALRIHVSPECKAVLDTLGGYHLEERGPVTMKGKGTIITYFLTGKDGFDKPLPELKDAARLEDHEFK